MKTTSKENYRMVCINGNIDLQKLNEFVFKQPLNKNSKNILLYIDHTKIKSFPDQLGYLSNDLEFYFAANFLKHSGTDVLIAKSNSSSYATQADIIINEMINDSVLSNELYNINSKYNQEKILITIIYFKYLNNYMALEKLVGKTLLTLDLRKNNLEVSL